MSQHTDSWSTFAGLSVQEEKRERKEKKKQQQFHKTDSE